MSKQIIGNTELIILGTGNAMVTKCYNTCFALKNNKGVFLVDAGGGNGILAQLEKVSIPFTEIHEMFITHGHTDHVLGVIWVIRKIAALMDKDKYPGNFTIYCHDELVKMVTMFCEQTLPKKLVRFIGDRILFHEVANGDTVQAIGIEFTFFDIASKKMKQFGFRAILPDGRTLVCLGDEPYNTIGKRYVENCNWLLSEAFCLYEDKDIFSPYEKHHSTALDAGKLAAELHVENLVLYHTEDSNLSERKRKYTQEVQSIFKGNVFVPDDLESIEL